MPPYPVKAQVSFSERFLEPVSLTEMFGLVAGNIRKAQSFSPECEARKTIPSAGFGQQTEGYVRPCLCMSWE